MLLNRFVGVVLSAWLVSVAPAAAEEAGDAWQALREGRAVLMLRHALAPGTGDPANFDLNDCSTQRNLNATGLAQARAWTPLLTERGIEKARVYTSQWCRSRDTATAMDMGPVHEWPSLNSFFGNRDDGPRQTSQTRKRVNELAPGAPVILVSHQVNITALADVYLSSNEGVIVGLPLSDSPQVLARVSPAR